MAENQVHVDYTIGSNQAQRELDKIQEKLRKVTDGFDHNVNNIRQNIEGLAKAMNEALKAGQPAEFTRLMRRQDRFLQYSSQSASPAGVPSNLANRASAQGFINDIVNSTQAAQARITDAIVKTSLQALRVSEAAISARIRQAQFTSAQSIANADPRYLAARSTRAEQNRQDTIFAAENSRAALASRNRFEQLNHNGGADLMAIQGRVMANYMAVGGLFNSAKSMISGVVELDKELHQFQAISTATNREMVTFKKNLLDISATVPFTTLEMTKAATMLAQAGLSTSQVTDSLGAVTKFATATGSDLSQAVDVVTSSLTAFNLETARTGDVANVFTAALNLSKLSVDKLVTALNYIGPTANEMGLTLEETTSVLGALSQSGIRASTMGTGFRALLTDLQSPSKKLTEALRAAGLTVEDINVRTKGFLPVMETLKTAGFGAAQAYETLELRSAAAFVALSNNLPLAYDLQRSFVLSAAATEANEIQMKSLANTAKNFGSVMSAAAYTGLEPVLGILQQIIEKATSVVSVLNEYPALLSTIGVAASALGAIMTASLGMSLLRSLGLMIPALGNISAGVSLVAGAAMSATTILGGLRAALMAVVALTPGGWIGIVATAAIAAGAAFMSWRKDADNLAESIDSLRGRVNELRGAADAAASRITSIDQALEGIINRRRELDDNELMRGAKIDELRSQFHELGLSIKDDTASVADLIRELHELKQTSSAVRRDELKEASAASQLQLDALMKQQRKLADPSGANANYLRGLADEQLGGWGGGIKQSENGRLASGIASRFGTEIGRAVQVALGDLSPVADNPLAAKSLMSALNAKIDTLRLRNDADSQTNIAFLEELKVILQPLVANLTEVGALTADMKVLTRQVAQSSVTSSSAYTTLQTRQENIRLGFDTQLAEINSSGLTNAKKIEALTSLRSWLNKVTERSVDSFKRDFEAESQTDTNLAGLDPNEVASQSASELGKLLLSLNEKVLKASSELTKSLDKELKKSQTNQSRELSRWQRQISSARNNEALEAAKEGYKIFLEGSRDQIVAYYDKLIALVGDKDPDTLERLTTERDEYLERLAAEQEEQARANIAKEQDLLKASLQRQRDAITDVTKGIQSQINLAIDELKQTPPGDAMNKLVAKIKELNAQLTGEFNKIGNIDIQLGGIDLSTPISDTVAKSAQSAVQHFISRGLSKAGAAAIAGNISVESGFDPNVKPGDNGTAHGVAQWRGTRWNELQMYAVEQGRHLRDPSLQYDFILKEMQRDYPELLAKLQRGGDPAGLARDFMNVFERPNKDPKVNHVQRRMDEATAFAGADVSATTAAANENDATLKKVVDENNAKSVKAISDASIKNLNARLGTLKTQARLNDDAGSIADIQKQVQQAHADIMKAETEKFEAANATLKTEDRAGYDAQLQELQERLRTNLSNDVLKIMEEYYKAAEEELNRPVDAAKATLDAARQPDMANKYTALDIQKMEQNVVDREREAAANRVLLIEQQISEVRRRATEAENTYGADSFEANMWRNQENDLIAKNNELKEKNNALDAAKAAQGPSVTAGIQSATTAWAQQNGILDNMGQMIPLGKQVENTWGGILDGLSSGFSTLFTNLASGTMSAKDAFKQLGMTILDMFMQIIAKALANQIIMSLFGGGAGGSGILGQLGQGLFGVIGMSTGGIPRAATGRKPAPFRDNLLVNVMPGEGILRKSAMDVIGEDGFNQINNLGNRQVSEGALKGKAAANDNNKQQGNGQVNVWVVSPDQVPPPGERDIIATIASNIQNRGTIKQLIQQVQMGAV